MSGRTPATERLDEEEEQEVRRVLLRMRAHSVGIALGLMFGLGLLLATVFLVVRGGENVGAHLGLLAAYFPGYRVTYAGSLIGFAYASVVGYLFGVTIGWLYSRLVDE